MRLAEALNRDNILVPLPADTLRGALAALVERLVRTGAVSRPEALEALTREDRIRDVVHVGDRVLLPHMRTDAVDGLVVALGVSPVPLRGEPGTEAGSERAVVLVLAPPDEANRYLQVVAAIARALRDDAVVDRLVQATSAEDVLRIAEIGDLVVPPRLTVRDIMAHRVFRVYPDTPVGELLDLMTRHGLKAVPVVNEKREVLGAVTDRDLLRHLTPASPRVDAGDTPDAKTRDQAALDVPVRDIMSRSVMCISEDQSISEVASLMIKKDVDRLPVVNEGRLAGFLTRGDILKKVYGR